MSSMVGKRYQQPRRAVREGEGTVFDDKLKQRKADEYTSQVHSVYDPETYTARDIAKEKALKQLKKGLRGKLYYGQEKV
tara:strand:- start:483 stop:719 length:237 start_codon:yes stop_codon:yes gene_type:complete